MPVPVPTADDVAAAIASATKPLSDALSALTARIAALEAHAEAAPVSPSIAIAPPIAALGTLAFHEVFAERQDLSFIGSNTWAARNPWDAPGIATPLADFALTPAGLIITYRGDSPSGSSFISTVPAFTPPFYVEVAAALDDSSTINLYGLSAGSAARSEIDVFESGTGATDAVSESYFQFTLHDPATGQQVAEYRWGPNVPGAIGGLHRYGVLVDPTDKTAGPNGTVTPYFDGAPYVDGRTGKPAHLPLYAGNNEPHLLSIGQFPKGGVAPNFPTQGTFAEVQIWTK